MIRVVMSGYEHFVIDRKSAITQTQVATAVREVIRGDTLYQFASTVENAMVLHGRAPVYVVPFGPNGVLSAFRHVMRGGLISAFLRDRFLPPTRVLRELLNSVRLSAAGVPTPEVIAVATYPGGGPFRRADVVTRYIEGGADLAAVLNDPRNDSQRRPILDAVSMLISRLTRAGAEHPDLNLKNILITSEPEGYLAYVLDVDRVHFHVEANPLVARANMGRLTRSLRKWRARPGARPDALPDDDLNYLALRVAVQPA